MTNRFENRVAVVTGGANGIGWATVTRLLDEGARVAVLDREDATARRRLAALGLDPDAPAGSRASAERTAVFACDVTDAASVDSAIAGVLERFGRIDVLASVAGGDRVVVDVLDEEHWRSTVEWNLLGPVRVVRACLHALIASRGAIVLVSSVNGVAAYGEPAYSSAKSGLVLLARNLAVQLGPRGVRVNVVAPGTVRTRVWDEQAGGADALTPLYPLGRVGEPADIAAAIAFLASDDASWITGITLPVDGGSLAGPAATMARLLGRTAAEG